jgi:hypothetical protein
MTTSDEGTPRIAEEHPKGGRIEKEKLEQVA